MQLIWTLVTRDGAEDANVRVPYPRALCYLYKPNLFLQPSLHRGRFSKVAYPVETHRLYHEVHKSLGKRIRQLRAPSLLDSSGFVPLLLLQAPRQAGGDCSALSALFSYPCKNSFDLTAESFACTFFTRYVIFGTSSNR